MLQKIAELPANVAGVKATGTVTAEDLKQVLIPALDELVKRTGKINYLLLLESDVSNWDFGAWMNDMKAGLKHLTKWNRIAVVSDQKGVNKITDVFGTFIPDGAKGFPLAQYEEAVAWVSEG